MRLLLDSDAFCKFAEIGLFDAAVNVVGVAVAACRRLPALQYMLRRGGLHDKLGDERSDRLLKIALSLQVAPPPSPIWIDRLMGVHQIDPGEAQLLALAAEHDDLLLTGDKRALEAVKAVGGMTGALRGKVVLPEVVLLRLCESLGETAVRDAVAKRRLADAMLDVVFSVGNPSPSVALRSYVDGATRTLTPLVLWAPPPRRSP